MKRIAIIGGGMSGLSAAFSLECLRLAGAPLEYVLFEAASRVGGVVRSERVGSFLVEAGPDSFLTEKPWAAELCHQLGIGDQLIGSNDAQRKTYILLDGKLTPMPDGMAFMVPTKILPVALSPLFSVSTKFKMLKEWFQPRREVAGDESVATFVERHYGKEMVERLADPLLSGVYGGNADQLSLKAVLPRFAEMQAIYGSLGKGIIKNRARATTGNPSSVFTTLRGGVQEMVNAIVRKLPPSCVRGDSSVASVRLLSRRWSVSSSPGREVPEEFDAVISAVPAYVAASLLSPHLAALAAELRDIRYSSSVTVSLAFSKQVRSKLPPGFGYLVPRTEAKRVLAVTFVHNKFSHRAPEGCALIRCFLGGASDEAVLELSETEILTIVLKELRQTLAIDVEPLFSRVYKWEAAMAQYNIGHLERVQRIENLTAKNQGLILAGNAYRGIGVPDCVRSGTRAAQQALASVVGQK